MKVAVFICWQNGKSVVVSFCLYVHRKVGLCFFLYAIVLFLEQADLFLYRLYPFT